MLCLGVIGVSGLLPGDAGAATEVLRPNAAGDYTNLPSQFPDSDEHWDKVDEEVPDDASTYVRDYQGTQHKDAYNLTDTSIPAGSTINSVTVYFRCRQEWAGTTDYCQPFLRLGTDETSGTEQITTTDWVTYSEALARPGGGSWSVSDLNNLQVVIGLRNGFTASWVECTQVYVEFDYSLPPTGSLINNAKINNTKIQ